MLTQYTYTYGKRHDKIDKFIRYAWREEHENHAHTTHIYTCSTSQITCIPVTSYHWCNKKFNSNTDNNTTHGSLDNRMHAMFLDKWDQAKWFVYAISKRNCTNNMTDYVKQSINLEF